MGARRPDFDLVVPLWNEEANVAELVRRIEASWLLRGGLRRCILVNNGSHDRTGAIVDELAATRPWIQPEHLTENRGYGGGIVHGMRCTRAAYIAYIPGDNQVSIDDLALVWGSLRALLRRRPEAKAFVKGWRHRRLDPVSMRFVSRVYTVLSNLLLHLRVRDVNALPKCFHRSLLDELPSDHYTTFTIEPQWLTLARRHGFTVVEIPVVFHARREGVSSWSGKRFRVYWQTWWQMYRLRRLWHGRPPRLRPPV